ncbi:MAG: carbohydrate ABC transporter permease [Lachnospiraceae bacterium]|nr:carbohydrate ABC transporter permease [Lachnospiraceae bacterium]
MQAEKQKATAGKVVSKIITYAFLIFMAAIVIFPFYWMIISSLKTLEEYRYTIPTFWPRKFDFDNYAEAFATAKLLILFRNTVIVGVVSTILSLVVTVLSAFAFARLEFKGKNLLFGALLATMMIPGELFTITNYATVNAFGWMNTFTVLIVPFLVSVYYIYLLRQNFLQIPNELYLAAKVDGTRDLKYLWKVMIPLSMPTLISITILKMMGAWNSYIWPRLVANDEAHALITYGLRNAFKDTSGNTDYPVQMAAVAVVSLPLFLVFVFLRKYIMKGVSRSGIKG